MRRTLGLAAALLALLPRLAAAQAPPTPQAGSAAVPTTDIFDVWRAFRHKEKAPEPAVWDYRKKMMAFAPVIGAKPSSGALSASLATRFYRGIRRPRASRRWSEPAFQSKGHTSLTDRSQFGDDDRWPRSDHRFQGTRSSRALGTSANSDDSVLTNFDYSGCITAHTVRRGLYAGGGFYSTIHHIGPDETARMRITGWRSAFVTYSTAYDCRSTRKHPLVRAWI